MKTRICSETLTSVWPGRMFQHPDFKRRELPRQRIWEPIFATGAMVNWGQPEEGDQEGSCQGKRRWPKEDPLSAEPHRKRNKIRHYGWGQMFTRFPGVLISQNTKSACCMPKPNVILHVNYTSIVIITKVKDCGLLRGERLSQAEWTDLSVARKTEGGRLSEITRRPTLAKCCFRRWQAGRWTRT